MCGCTRQAVSCRVGTQTATFFQLICVSYLEHLRPNLLDLIQKTFVAEELT